MHEVTASSSDGNLPENTIDGDLTTRWSAKTTDPANPEWIRWDLGEVRTVGYVGIAWHQGDRRTSQFDLQVSDDGSTWTTVVDDASSSGGTTDLEPVELGVAPESGLEARYVRYLGYGNSSGNDWNSVNEVRVYPPDPDGAVVEELASTLPEPDPDAEPWTAPGLVEPGGEPHVLTPPAPVIGRTLDVLDYGADPADGTGDDAAAIRAAISAAEPGDEVFLPPGIYDLDTTVPADPTTNIALRSGIHLRGAGTDDTILRSALTPETSSGKVIRGMGVTDVIISDLTVTSTFDGPFSDDPDAAAGGGPSYGIFVSNLGIRPSLRVVVDGVTVERYQRMGVRIEKSREVVVRGCTFRNATSVGDGGAGYGVTIQGTPLEDRYAYPDDSRHNIVKNNTFEGPYLRHAILLQYYTHNNLVVGNRITGTVLDAIDLHGEDEYLNEVRANTVVSSRAAGIALGNTGGTATQHDASGPGNWIHGNVLQGNREGVLVHIGSPDTLIEDNVIVRGHRSPAEVGIEVRNAPGTVVRSNTITGNRADGFWGVRLTEDPGDDGHAAGIPTDVLIERNVVAANTNGVRIDAGTGIVLDGNVVRGNTDEQLRIDDSADVVVR
ncbi:parallel beta helix pectate lyase-like protein [Haloactinopolyspora alba]|uniref:Parallel beta helix pectate lyase-like protein n=1 Tax=Haloactinopolyspora alba TaxID=648780 RepID=A0A2P8E131_9ACTN|nr:right-handed parallel beta-helix repeat-containing protein [Haloactinopolyspora alba]PSL03149.1 parallel beta helix pectate lyase-like protein [Haloactinopolyspora alba]